MLRYRTKDVRLVAVLNTYRQIVGGAFRMDDLAEWAMRHGLYPIPTRHCSIDEAEAWEERLAAAAPPKELSAPANHWLTSGRGVRPEVIAAGQLPRTLRSPIRCEVCRNLTIYVAHDTRTCWECHITARKELR